LQIAKGSVAISIPLGIRYSDPDVATHVKWQRYAREDAREDFEIEKLKMAHNDDLNNESAQVNVHTEDKINKMRVPHVQEAIISNPTKSDRIKKSTVRSLLTAQLSH